MEEINEIRNNTIEDMNQEEELDKLKDKNQDFQNLYELESNGYIIRSKAEYSKTRAYHFVTIGYIKRTKIIL